MGGGGAESRREAEREQFNAVIKFLIAPWEMCSGVAPGQLSVAPRLLNTQSMSPHTQHNTQHTAFERTGN